MKPKGKIIKKKPAAKKPAKKQYEYFIVYQDQSRRVQNLVSLFEYKINGSRENIIRTHQEMRRVTNDNYQGIIWFCEVK